MTSARWLATDTWPSFPQQEKTKAMKKHLTFEWSVERRVLEGSEDVERQLW